MKNLKQLETELVNCEKVDAENQYQVTGGKVYTAADDKRRERPGSTIGNRASGGGRRYGNNTCVDATKEG